MTQQNFEHFVRRLEAVREDIWSIDGLNLQHSPGLDWVFMRRKLDEVANHIMDEVGAEEYTRIVKQANTGATKP